MRTVFILAFLSSVAVGQSPEAQGVQDKLRASLEIEEAALAKNPLPPGKAYGNYLDEVQRPWFKEQFGDSFSYNKMQDILNLAKLRSGEIKKLLKAFVKANPDDMHALTRAVSTIADPMLDVAREELRPMLGPEACSAIDHRIIIMRLTMSCSSDGFALTGSPDYPELVAIWEATEDKDELTRYLEDWAEVCNEQKLDFAERAALLIGGSQRFGGLFETVFD